MKAFLFVLPVKHALRTAALAALGLGLVAKAPLQAEELPLALHEVNKVLPATPGQLGVKEHDERSPQDSAMEDLHTRLSSGENLPANSDASGREALAVGTELLSDGGFEGGYYGGSQMGTSGVSGPWTWTNSPSWLSPIWTDPPTHTGAPTPRTGAWCVYFNPFGPSSARLYQTVSIPAGVTTLSFSLKVLTSETTHAVAYDTLKVRIANTSGTPLGEATYSNLDANASWIRHSLDISAYAGATVRLQFDTSEDSSKETIFLIDDVSILASASTASCTEDSYTMCLVNGRYKVTSHWRNQYAGGAVATLSKAKLTDTTGAFWTADASTFEYLIRFNTATNNGRAWVAIPTFTDVEFWIAVTDTVSGQYKEYHSTPGNQTMIYDSSYFVYP